MHIGMCLWKNRYGPDTEIPYFIKIDPLIQPNQTKIKIMLVAHILVKQIRIMIGTMVV